MKIYQKITKSTRGQSMVETALLLPLLLLIVFAIIEFGFMFGSYVIIHDLARDGARAGAVGADNDTIETQIKDNAVLLDIDNITVNFDPVSDADRVVGGSIKVGVDYTYNMLTPILSSVLGNTVDMSEEYVMRIEVIPEST